MNRRDLLIGLFATAGTAAHAQRWIGRPRAIHPGFSFLTSGFTLPASFVRPAIRSVPTITGTIYYVNGSTGSDTNTGKSQAQAWKTLDQASSQAYNLVAGDAILFAGGQTFTGTAPLYMGPLGTAAKPFQIGSYGTGRATLQVPVAGGPVVCPYAISYQVISNLIIDGGNTADQGLYIGNDSSRAVTETGFTVINCDFINCKVAGALVQADTAGSKITNVVFSGCNFHNNTGNGFQTYSQDTGAQGYTGKAARSITGLVMENCTAYSNGSAGILPAQCMGTISWCTAYSNGSTTTNQSGFWWYDCTNLYVTFCESYGNTSSNQSDGSGFDQDGGNYQCGVEFCYAHGNSGPGFEQVTYPSGGTSSDCYVRNCVSMFNCTSASLPGELALYVATGTSMTSCHFYNNTCVSNMSAAGSGTFSSTGAVPTTCYVVNNIFHKTNTGGYQVHIDQFTGLTFKSNLYSGSTSFSYGSSTTSIATWMTASAESNAQVETEASYPVTAPTTGGYNPTNMAGYFKPSGSLAVSAGANENVALGLVTPNYDAWGNVFQWTTIGAGR